MITPSEFEEWQSHFVTKAYAEAVNLRIEEAKEVLAGSAGIDSNQDNFIRGMIVAFREVLDFKATEQETE